jgi:general secretion pathway protein I
MSWEMRRAEFQLATPRGLRRVLQAARQNAAGCAGFTLIEVVVAIAVLAVVLGAIGAAVGTTVKGMRSVDQKLPLLETAQSLLASLPERDALRPGVQSGRTGDVRWRADIAPLDGVIADAPTSEKWLPLLVTVTVQGSEGPPVRLDTIRLVPRPAR